MREELLPDTDGLILQKTRSTVKCAYSGQEIPKGVHAVSIREDRGGHAYVIWLAVGAVDDFTVELLQLDAAELSLESEHIIEIGERIYYAEYRGPGRNCCICGESIGSEEILMTDGGESVWIHLDCRHELVNGLERVWEHATNLLPEQV